MKTSECISEISTALAKAQAEMKNPEKNKTATIPMKSGGKFSYNYADLPTTFDTVRECLAKNGLSHSSATCLHDGALILSMRLYHASGQWYESEMPLQAQQDPKLMAANLTYYRRYLFNGLVGISGDDDIDNDQEETTFKPVQKPIAEQVKAAQERAIGGPSEAQIKRLFAIARSAGWSTPNVKELMSSKYGIESTKDLNREQYDYICTFMEQNPGSPEPGSNG